MEKTKLVRTFGTALATATLSFGLFAAPAIADPEAKPAGDTVILADGVTKDWKVVAGETINLKFRIPVTLTDIDDAGFTTVTFSNKALGRAQELDAMVIGWYDDETGGNEVSGYLSKHKKVWAEVNLESVPKSALNGTWQAKDLTIWDADTNPIVVNLSGAKFQLTEGAKSITAPEFEEGSLTLLRSTLTSKDDNELSVRYEDELRPDYGIDDDVQATYINPAGNQRVFILGTSQIAMNNTQDHVYKATTTSLGNATQGNYTLQELVVRHQIAGLNTKSTENDPIEYAATDETHGVVFTDADAMSRRTAITSAQQTTDSVRKYVDADGNVLWLLNDNETVFESEDGSVFTKTEKDVTYDADKNVLLEAVDDTVEILDDRIGLFNVDYYSPLEGGNYVVNAGLVIPMYRAYNPYDGQHLYTDSAEEIAAAVAAGWKDEGIAWFAPADIWDSAVKKPVYRLYNQYNGDHHYTIGKAEAEAMVAAGWTDEGVGFYSLIENATLTNPLASAKAVYRVFNPFEKIGTHHYTTSKDEQEDLVKLGWNDEGIGWYGVNWEKRNR